MINNKILRKDNIQEILSLSPTQQGLLFKYQMDPESSEYMEQVVLKIKGDITDKEIEKVWHHLISTYDGLRSIYKWEKLSNPIQIVLKEIDLPLYFEEREGDCTTLLNEIQASELKKGIDLTTEPLRIRLVNGANNEKIMILTYHHILWDGWSSGILIDSFTRLCNEIEVDKELPSKIKVTPWREYIKLVRNRDIDAEKKYWANYLDGVERNEISPQPTHNKHTDNKSYRESFYIEDIDYEILKNACKEHKHTLAGWIHSGLGILLQIHSNHNDIIFGSTVSGRNVNLPSVEHMIGLFINTLPIRVIKNTDTKVFELIRHVEKSMNERSPYETTPLSSIKEYCGFNGEEGLFDTILVFENYPLNLDRNSKVDIDVLSVSEDTHFGLTIMVMEKNDKLEFVLNYKSNKFNREWIHNFIKLLYKVILKMVNYYYDKVIDIDLLDEEEKHQLLAQYTKSEYSNDDLFMEKFESHAVSHPDKIALIYENQTMTYRELNEEANQLARYFIDHGVKKESVVGIKMNRSIDMMVVIFGILKSGAAYLPIGIDTPQARIDYMLSDSECKLLITDQAKEKASYYENTDVKSISYGHIKDLLQDYEKTNYKIENIRKSKAYIIYTSGSTGQPKGVVVEHDALTERMNWFHATYMREETSRILLKTAITFDVSITELFGWIGCQGQLVILPEGEEKNGTKIRETVICYDVTDLNFTPSAFKVMGNELQNVASIQRIYLAGEALTKDVVQEAFRINSTLEVFNLYGPTETVIYATGTKIEKESSSITIGKPIDNVSVYILDSNQRLCPVGIIGELYISGNSLARGYLNNPELTAERFIENPYAANQRMYKTGDLVRWTHDGHIEYLGRIDHQVKIRGYRIELGEIESSISEQEGVKEVVVLNRKDASGMDYLCAYVVKEETTAIEKIKEGISQELPHYMVPGAFVEIEAIPITANGKVNLARLLEMEVTYTRENAYQAATNELEEKLVAIWADVLGVERIGIHDNFFELGGHSLGVIKLMSTIQREFGKSLSYRDLYIDSTISKLAKKIESIEEEYANTIPALEASELYDVSFAQRRMWIINELNPQSIAYNMPGRFVIKDTEPEEAFKATINALVMKHESFRTSFIEKDGNVFQKIEEYQAVELDIEDLMQLQEEEKYQKMLDAESLIFAQPFNLKESGLYRMKILRINVDHYEVLFCIHHIISDGVSMGIIRNEFFKYYENYKQNKRLPITPLKIQYKDFAAWQNNIIEEKMDEALHYWERKFVNFPDKLLLPERMIMDYDGNDGQYNVVIDNDLNQKIKALVSTTQISVFSLFLSSLYVLLNRMTGQDDIIIGSPVAGREHFETEEIVGCFVNTLILREKINRNERFNHFLQHVSTSVSEAVTYQAYPLELVLENLQMKYPDIQVFLNINNFSNVNELKNNQYDFSKNVNVKFDMIFYITPLDDRILLTCEYRKTKFKNTDIQHIVGELIKVISDAASYSEKSISEIGLTTRRRLVKR